MIVFRSPDAGLITAHLDQPAKSPSSLRPFRSTRQRIAPDAPQHVTVSDTSARPTTDPAIPADDRTVADHTTHDHPATIQPAPDGATTRPTRWSDRRESVTIIFRDARAKSSYI
jgi:hypothetical protein